MGTGSSVTPRSMTNPTAASTHWTGDDVSYLRLLDDIAAEEGHVPPNDEA